MTSKMKLIAELMTATTPFFDFDSNNKRKVYSKKQRVIRKKTNKKAKKDRARK